MHNITHLWKAISLYKARSNIWRHFVFVVFFFSLFYVAKISNNKNDFVNNFHCVKSVHIQSYSGPNVGKYVPEELRIQTHFMQCLRVGLFLHVTLIHLWSRFSIYQKSVQKKKQQQQHQWTGFCMMGIFALTL